MDISRDLTPEKGLMRIFKFNNPLMAIIIIFMIMFISTVCAQNIQSPLNDKENQLANLVNQYRIGNGLPAIPVTNSLTNVARTHIKDLITNSPDTANHESGDCSTHSWSNRGDWTAVCYTGSESQSKMHSKPSEITNGIYNSDGYEITVYATPEATPEGALNTWKGSSLHNDVILERNIWAGSSWKAMGVGIDGNYAVVWFGKIADPAGMVSTSGSVTNPDYPDIQGPACTKSYCTDINVLHKCVSNRETIVPQGCFLGIFGPPNEQFRVGDGPNAFADVYYAEFNVDIVGGKGQADAVRDAPKLIILIDKTVSGGVNLNQDSQFTINDRPARKLKDFDSKTTDEGKDKLLYKLAASDLHEGTNKLKISPKGDDFAIYKIWIENAKGERIWQEKNDPCAYQSECKFDDRYNPYQLACDFTAIQKVCKEKKASGKSCSKNFECISGKCSANVCT